MKSKIAILCLTALFVLNAYALCGYITYFDDATGKDCGAYFCQSCCNYTQYDATCSYCSLDIDPHHACYNDVPYTVHAQKKKLGTCINGSCGGGLNDGNPTDKTCYYTSEGSCWADQRFYVGNFGAVPVKGTAPADSAISVRFQQTRNVNGGVFGEGGI